MRYEAFYLPTDDDQKVTISAATMAELGDVLVQAEIKSEPLLVLSEMRAETGSDIKLVEVFTTDKNMIPVLRWLFGQCYDRSPIYATFQGIAIFGKTMDEVIQTLSDKGYV